MGVWGIADGHTPPAFKPVEVPFHDIARWVPFQVVGLGGCAPGRNDGPDALPRPSGAQGVNVIGPVRDQARPRRVRPGFHQDPRVGAVEVLAARHAQVQGTALATR